MIAQQPPPPISAITVPLNAPGIIPAQKTPTTKPNEKSNNSECNEEFLTLEEKANCGQHVYSYEALAEKADDYACEFNINGEKKTQITGEVIKIIKFIENGIIEISPEHNEERFYNDKIGLNTYEGIFDWTPDEKSPARITFNATGYVMLDGALDQWPCFTWTYTILQ